MISLLLAAGITAAQPVVPPPSAPVASIAALADNDLQDVRGGASPQVATGLPSALDSAVSLQSLSGEVTGNSVSAQSVSSGGINFNGSALSGFSGIGNFILNTGMNSLLQGSVSLTVNLVGAP